MKSVLFCILFLTIAAAYLLVAASPQDTVEETSTGKFFPTAVSFEYDGGAYNLKLTGVSVRKKAIFKGYGVAHYMDTATFDDKDAAFAAVLDDKYAKQLTLDFARGVDAEKIQKAFRDGFKKQASDTEFAEIATLVDGFAAYFGEKVEEDDQYIFRWLPGGIVLTTVKGVEMDPITSVTFATVLWRVWLAKGSIVNRDKLIKMAIPD